MTLIRIVITTELSKASGFKTVIGIDSNHRFLKMPFMKFFAISGSARARSTNTTMLRAAGAVAPGGIKVEVFSNLGRLPVFSPDLEGVHLPNEVRSFISNIAECDGVIIASPEYVRSIPGGLKNAIDWLVSGEEIIEKPIVLMHASHRGDDMLSNLRTVLSTITENFAQDIFLRLDLMKMEPSDIARFIEAPENQKMVRAFLLSFASFCMSKTESV